jgi:predicted glycosyltransferase
MPRYLFSSHDGFGLGHTRRNSLIARALLDAEPTATVTLFTGLGVEQPWLTHPRLRIVRVPALVKDKEGRYTSADMALRDALAIRATTFNALVADEEPDVVIVDRHPYGTFGELRQGLLRARLQGAALVLGLRDVLDEPGRVGRELMGGAWEGVREIYTNVLVYGDPRICDHEAEYGLPVEPVYCGWVTQPSPVGAFDPDLLVVAAGGGGDGRAVFELGTALLRERPDWRAIVLAGPFADDASTDADERIEFVRNPPDTLSYLARAAGVLQMAGYNSTLEALAAGLRPILLPRRSPRREQAIRALRLASLGLADVVDHGADAAEVAWLLDQPRRLEPDAVERAGIRFDGASRAATHISSLCMAQVS